MGGRQPLPTPTNRNLQSAAAHRPQGWKHCRGLRAHPRWHRMSPPPNNTRSHLELLFSRGRSGFYTGFAINRRFNMQPRPLRPCLFTSCRGRGRVGGLGVLCIYRAASGAWQQIGVCSIGGCVVMRGRPRKRPCSC